jgi:multiple sugar transport system permease protein
MTKTAAHPLPAAARGGGTAATAAYDFSRKYWLFALPGVLVVGAVIVFPWAFTLWMSLH